MRTSAGFELGTVLAKVPSVWRSDHVLVEIKTAYAFGWANRLWSRRHAVWLAFQANMEAAESRGRGISAYRRLCRVAGVSPNHATVMTGQPSFR